MRRVVSRSIDSLRGLAMGVAEIIPGVSGGTVALLVGVYDTLISSAATLVRSVRSLFRRQSRSTDITALAGVPWWRLVAIAAGMVVGILVGAAVIEPLIVAYPEFTRAFFAGLIIASVWVPLRMVGWPLRPGEPLLMVLVAGALFVGLGIAPLGSADPQPWVIVASAAIAVCALVLPGVSGSFLLLTLGLYEPTVAAVNDRDLEYLGLFVVGAVIGLATFVLALQWLLTRLRRITLVVMTGLLVGSLRALWPWQGDDRGLLGASDDQLLPALAWAVAGIVVVVSLMALERRVSRLSS